MVLTSARRCAERGGNNSEWPCQQEVLPAQLSPLGEQGVPKNLRTKWKGGFNASLEQMALVPESINTIY